MSASSHSEKSPSSFWSLFNVALAVILGGFTLFWALALFYGAVAETSGWNKKEAASSEAPAAVAAPAQAEPAAPAEIAEITIKPDTANPLAYDLKEFKVKAGQKVKVTFNNTHPAVPQPHNLVIGAIGSKDKLLALAMQMAAAPDGMAKGFIPDSPDVLFHTKLLQPNSAEVLEFTAPAAGEYPYVCTFPGHGAIMNGVMKVE
jgi:azurin